MSHTLIAGAGPAGLTAAYELAQLGLTSTILEANQQVGGLSQTVNYKGFRFDIGGHRFFSKVPLINELWHQILDHDDFLIRPRLSRIHYRGRFFDYPLKAANALAGLGPVEAMLIALSYTKAKIAPTADESTFEQWVCNRFGRRLYEIFFKTYTEKVWGIPCNEISADWAAQRIKNLSLTEALRNALIGKGVAKDGQVITTLIDEFQYPRLGPGMMWEKCEDLLHGKGSPTLRGIRVDRLRHRNGHIEAAYARSGQGEHVEYDADHFVSTMPLRHLIHCLDPVPPDEVIRAANGLRYRDFLTVVLIVDRPEVFPDNWIYIHSSDVRMGRIQNYKNWSPEMVPDDARTSLGLEYFLWDSDAMWSWPDDRLIEIGIDECVKLGLVERDEVVDGTVVRMKKAYPVYDQAYPRHLAVIQQYLSQIDNLQTIGRNGQHRYNNQDHSMLTGVYAARNITGEHHDVWSVNVDQEYHEESREGQRLTPKRVTPTLQTIPATIDDMIAVAFSRLDPVAMGVAVATVCGCAIFLASIILLLRGGDVIGPNLSLLNHYLLGFDVTWIGSLVGMIEGALAGFLLGFGGASLRNWCISAYAYYVKRSANAKQRRDFLGQM